MFDETFTEASGQRGSASRRGHRIISLAAILVSLVSSAASANDFDSENLRGLAQTEMDAGRVTTVHVVEAYHVMGIVTSHHRMPREWGEGFCSHATRVFVWRRTWTVMVYAHREAQASYSCQIGTVSNR
jgi:hypothetical protein